MNKGVWFLADRDEGVHAELGKRIAHGVLVFWGVVSVGHPLVDALWYGCFAKVLAAFCLICSICLLVLEPDLLYEHIANIAVAAGAFLGLIFSRNVADLIGPRGDPVGMYLRSHKVMRKFGRKSMRILGFTVGVWMLALALRIWEDVGWSRVCAQLDACDRNRNVALIIVAFMAYFYASGLLMAVVFCFLHLLIALEIMVHQFTVQFFLSPECKTGVSSWNSVQTLLRHIGTKMDSALLSVMTLQVFAVLAHCCRVVSIIVELWTGVFLEKGHYDGFRDQYWLQVFGILPTLSLSCCVGVAFIKAVGVSQICSRLPSLINSLAVSEKPADRQCIVQFIASSEPGFFIRGVKLTPALAMKMIYMLVVLVSGITTTLMQLVRLGY